MWQPSAHRVDLASNFFPGEVRVFDRQTARPVVGFAGGMSAISCMAVSRTADMIAAASVNGGVRIWDADTHDVVIDLETEANKITSLAFGPQGQWLVTGCGDGDVMIRNIVDGTLVAVLEAHNRPVTCVDVSVDRRLIASSTSAIDRTDHSNSRTFWTSSSETKLWDASSADVVFHWDGGFQVAFSPDGKQIAIAENSLRNEDGEQPKSRIIVRDSKTGQQIGSFEGHEYPVTSISWSGDGRSLATCSSASEWGDERGRNEGLELASRGPATQIIRCGRIGGCAGS